MATKTVMNSAVVLLLAISQLVHIATARELLPPADPTTASSLVTTGFDVSHGHGHGHGDGATEEKVLLDAPRNIPVPSTPPLQGKRNTSSLASSLLVTSVSGPPSSADFSKAPSSTEEKVLLDAPKWFVPSSPPLQGK